MMRQFLKLGYTEFRIFLREPVTIFFNLFFPLMFLFLSMHLFTKNPMESGIINYYIPSFTVIIMMGITIFNIPIYIVKYRNIKFLKRLRVAPIRPLTIMLALGVANLFMLLLGLLILIMVGTLLYHGRFTGNVLAFTGGVALCFAGLGSIGLLLASLIRGIRTVNVLGQLIFYPMLFFSGVLPIPLPNWLQPISKILPVSYGVELLLRIWNLEFFNNYVVDKYKIIATPHTYQTDIFILLGWMVVCTLLSAKFFKWE